jgi:hypothetical protein
VSEFNVVVDARQVREVFRRAPQAAVRAINQLVEAGAIDTQAEMRRQVNVGATGHGRRAITYTTQPSTLSAKVTPNFPYALPLEEGSRPHWTSARPGSPLAKWANMKGISPYAVQRSIAKKGTKAHPFVAPTYRLMIPRVQRLVVVGMNRFVREVNSGVV